MRVIKYSFSKFIALLLLVSGLFSSSSVWAQAAADTSGSDVDKTGMWLGIGAVILGLILAGLLLALVGRILKVFELSSGISGKGAGINWNSANAYMMIVFLVVGFIGIIWEFMVHGPKILPESGSVHGQTIDNLFMVTLWITGIVFVITQILLFTYPFLYRYQKGRKALYYPDNDKLEQAWTIVPAIVLTVLVIFGFFTWQHITSGEELKGKKPVIVEITGQQFQWDIRYPGKDGILGRKNYKLITDLNYLGVDFTDKNSADDIIDKQGDTIYLPVNRPVKLVLGAKDVIHSCYMPFFRVQMNCVPGLPTYFYFTPRYTTQQMRSKLGDDNFNYILLCAKICGNSHYNMGRVIKVVEEQEYTTWKSKLKPWYDADIQKQLKAAENLKNHTNTSKQIASNLSIY
jgi:cytochrome c oxidase subunit 2